MSEIKDKPDQDLKDLLAEKREAARKARFGEAGARTRNVKAGSVLRKEIARILTELRRRGA